MKSTILIFLSIPIIALTKIAVLEERPYSFQMDFTLKLFEAYNNFQMVFHSENKTVIFMERLLTQLQKGVTPITMYNHDILTNDIFIRPSTVQCLHIVMFQKPTLFSRYLQYKRNVLEKDIVIFIVLEINNFSNNYWFMPLLERAGNILLLDFKDRQNLKLYKLCYYCGFKSKNVTLIKIISNFNFTIPYSYLYAKNFTRFYGHKMKVAFINYYPYAFALPNDNNITIKPQGMEIKMLEVLSKKMNFSYQLEQVNLTYNDLIEKLASGHFDFAIGGLSMTPDRVSSVRFSNIFKIEPIVASYIYFSISPKSTFFAFLTLFPPYVWLIIFIMILITTVLVCFLLKLTEIDIRKDFFKVVATVELIFCVF